MVKGNIRKKRKVTDDKVAEEVEAARSRALHVDHSGVREIPDDDLFFTEAQKSSQMQKKKKPKPGKFLKAHRVLEEGDTVRKYIVPSRKARPMNIRPKRSDTSKEKTPIEVEKKKEEHGLEYVEDFWLSHGVDDEKVGSKRSRPTKSERPAVEVPSSGVSYNPSTEEHQKYLTQLYEREERRLEKEEAITRALSFSKETAEIEGDGVVSGLKIDAMYENMEEEEDSDENDEKGVKKEPKRKTKRDRKKDEKKVARQKEEKIKREKRRREQDFKKIGKIVASLDALEKKKALKVAKRELKRRERKRLGLENIGVGKVRSPTIDVAFTDELQGNLRSATMRGSILHDRLRSFELRNMIERVGPEQKRNRSRDKRLKRTKRFKITYGPPR